MRRILSVFAICYLALTGAASAATIVSAVSATATDDVGNTIGRTIDQSGLNVNYISGVTDFDAYMALNPIHSLIFVGNEWFTNSNVVSATLVFDLGSVMAIDRLALWNEDAAGFGFGRVSTSVDGSNYSFLTNITPTDNPLNVDYGAEVFGFGVTAARYFQIEVRDCPQPDPNGNIYTGCAMGEIAFSAVNVIPVPAAGLLVLTGIAALGLARRRKNKIS